MREIKFRVWDGDKFIWNSQGSQQDKQHFFIGVEGFIYAKYGRTEYHENLVIQQFTGFKDKNNKDIYEGDIVKFEHDEEICGPCSYPKRRKYLGQVVDVYLIQHAKPSIFKEYREKLIKHCQGKKIEIVGNIFENPELLK